MVHGVNISLKFAFISLITFYIDFLVETVIKILGLSHHGIRVKQIRNRIKRSAVKAGVDVEPGGKDERVGKWWYVSSPGDLFKHGIDIDFVKLRYHPLTYNKSV